MLHVRRVCLVWGFSSRTAGCEQGILSKVWAPEWRLHAVCISVEETLLVRPMAEQEEA